MSISRKYGRTYHYTFSLGTTSDDRFNHQWWEDVSKIDTIIHTEKLDGENTCLNDIGVFARSHAAPTRHPCAGYLKERWSLMQADLESLNLEIFGENLYAIHSIGYSNLKEHFYVFAVRQNGIWLSWQDVCDWAEYFGFPTVPVLGYSKPKEMTVEEYEYQVLSYVDKPSAFDSFDNIVGCACTMEGVVSRNIDAFPVDKFKQNVFKYVRASHVKTDKHWSRNWKRARLVHEN